LADRAEMEDERTSLKENDMLFRDVMTSPAVTFAPDLSRRRGAQLLDRLVTGVPGMTAVRFR
jgi:hypothetical protein